MNEREESTADQPHQHIHLPRADDQAARSAARAGNPAGAMRDKMQVHDALLAVLKGGYCVSAWMMLLVLSPALSVTVSCTV